MGFFLNNKVKLTSVQKDSCEGQITEEELLDAIKAFKSGTTPGLNGIPNLPNLPNFYTERTNISMF
jgi:hypothetical protein